MFRFATRTAIAALSLSAMTATAMAAEVNVYSSRHYDSDDALYEKFTDETGITVNRIEGKADELIARLKAEGDNSPADVFITVDIGRMGRAEEAGVIQPLASDVIANTVPAHLRHPDDLWFGVSQRARIIFYAKDRVENPPMTYEALTDDEWKGRICIRSSSNIYNQSLLASIIEADGEEGAREWATGMVDNMARAPQGGDTDQLRGLVSGECDVAVANHYYFLRGFDKDVEGLTSGIDNIGWVWPNQSDRGAHLNLTAAAMTVSSPNPDQARTLLEFLTSAYAQQHFADQNNEYPAVPGVGLGAGPARLGFFIPDTATPTAAFSANAAKAQTIFNQVGWQ
ncbi:extracellular solute-binding protein [Roseovarius pelagicus]|uniref:Extracellular solute-binding protein n=1 Tax=Roseovarius pelagicus TaxID=2980108 RepID=A0ABY6DBV5_9RHOB|nr:extracellular solute-binding protein [Roseovarius pelagicus]UXX82498.1 extracellular solute-binding protein [Roseovarius pelagicus]